MPRKRLRDSRASASGTEKRARVDEWRGSLFARMVQGAGLELAGHAPSFLGGEVSVFQRQLALSFRASPEAVTEFTAGLKDYCSDPLALQAALQPLRLGEETRTTLPGQHSLVRALLGVDAIQPAVIDLLMLQLEQRVDPGLTSPILANLKMMNHIVNGEEFCSRLFAVIESSPLAVQREIISSLPDMVDDPQHDKAAEILRRLLSTTPGLTTVIMDALASLVISNQIAASLLDVAMETLQLASEEEMPVLINFVMEYVNNKNATEIIRELRSNLRLDFSPLHGNIASSTPLEPGSNQLSARISDQFVIFDTIVAHMKLRKSVADGWLKTLEGVEEHKPLDLLVLLFLYSLPGRRKPVETLLTNKIKHNSFNDDLLSTAFGSHAKALVEYFRSVLGLCDSLLSSSSPSVSAFAASLYTHLFTSFDAVHQQEVARALVTHVYNGTSSEVDHALSILLGLARSQQAAMAGLTAILKGVLDCLEVLSHSQIRLVYELLTSLALCGRGNSLEDELMILIRKQLSHVDHKYRQMGVIGGVMIIKQLSRDREGDFPSTTSQSMLTELIGSCKKNADSVILFCEEMACIVSSLDKSSLKELTEEVTSEFQDDYLVESSEGVAGGVALQYGLDSSDEEEGIVLNLWPLLTRDGAERLRPLSARLSLLAQCELALHGNLGEIDALLGCPVAMATGLSREALESSANKSEACAGLFLVLGWFRELVSWFSTESDPELRGKVLLRLEHITSLQSQLEVAMTTNPSWRPPIIHSADISNKLLKKPKKDVTLASITAATIDKEAIGVAEKSSPTVVTIDLVREWFRPLRLGMLKSLGYGSLFRSVMNEQNHTESREELKLHPPQLHFLLDHLSAKLSGAFAGFGRARGNPVELVEAMSWLFPLLCDQLEVVAGYFRRQLEVADGLVELLPSCPQFPVNTMNLHLLLKSMATFLSWPGITEHAQCLQLCLQTMASRHSDSDSPTRNICKYLEGFVSVLPTLSSAHSLAQLLVSVVKQYKAESVQEGVAAVCGDLLKRAWPISEPTPTKREAIEYLLRYHIEWSADPLLVVETIVGGPTLELLEEGGTFPTLSRLSFPWWYRVMLTAVVKQLKSIPEQLEEGLARLELSVKVLYMLVSLVKSFCKKTVLSSCLKYGRLFLESFLKVGVPILDALFKSNKDEVVGVVKTLQQSTRWLHHYCGHSKVERDANLVNHIPPLKKTLELFIYRVKEVLSAHNCGDAFWLGVLKNRDIKGQEISSQQPSNEDEESDMESTSTCLDD